ncbi:MAG: respiratory nitrate reductase subunit gamma [Candidatus Nanopelagicales bacterium]|nr:respiratory nitrate reductase subunit gamma [Candidatus Nanopelagicales bacterium]
MITAPQVMLWVVLPYVTITVFVVGMIWRFRTDKFGWTTRSSELYERKMLRIASPLFHFALLAVVLGHIMGLVIPESWTSGLGISEDTYHLMAVSLGLVSGACVLAGLAFLIYRRSTVRAVSSSTTGNDRFMYVFLVAAICLGLLTTVYGSGLLGESYNYRETVSPWFRSIFLLDPKPELMAQTPFSYQWHAVAGMLVFIIWPFTRLVHAFSAPIGYMFRPYVVYRSRGKQDVGSGVLSRGEERVG